MEPTEDEVILPEEGSGEALERDLDEVYGREPRKKEKECTGASSDSV